MGDVRRLAERVLGGRRIPQVAFEIDDAGGPHEVRVDVVDREVLAGAEIGVHGALTVGRHQDVGAGRRRTVDRRRGGEMHARAPEIVGEIAADLIVADLADEGAARPELGGADRRVGGRAARDDHGLTHGGVEILGPRLVDQVHGALGNGALFQKRVVDRGENVDDGVPEAQEVVGRGGHGITREAREVEASRTIAPAASSQGLQRADAEEQRKADRQHQQGRHDLEARATSAPRPSSEPASLMAMPLARTAVAARAAVVMAVPSAITTVAAMPARKMPCERAKTSTRIAPEQGRAPAATTVDTDSRQENPSPSVAGSGAW